MKIHCKHSELITIKTLKFNPLNANKHSKEQIERLAKILDYQGWRVPVKISIESGFITSGHGRVLAAKKLGWTAVPVDFQHYENNDMEIADLHADNEIARWAELDMSMLNQSLESFDPEFDLELLGLKNFNIDGADNEGLTDPDEVPDVPKESVTKLGDIYKLGNHKLMCGDSTDILAVEKLMNGEKADMVFTDPPYGVSYQSNMRTKSTKFDVIKNDESFISEWVNVLPIVSSGWVFIWTTWKVIKQWLEITAPIGTLSNVIVWDKGGGGGIGDLEGTFATDYEISLVYNRDAKITGKRLGSVWSIGKDRHTDYKHPTQKPVELATTAIENCTNNKSKVLDLFGGSGSTLIACEKTNRKCFMMELDPIYCDVIVSRWENFTGNKAELIV